MGDLFEINSSKKRFDANKVEVLESGKFPYVVRMGSNNGQKGFINEDKQFLNDGNTISFGQDTATMFYQENPYFTGDKIKILKSKYGKFNKNNALFFILSISNAFSSFSWGASSFNVKKLENQIIQLPIKKGQIDFAFMESFIAALETDRLTLLEAYLLTTGLKDYTLTAQEQHVLVDFENIKWSNFKLGVLFDRIKTKKLSFKADELPNQIIGKYTLPCLTSSFKNQGLNYYAPKDEATILKNLISIPSNSDIYRAYYQPHDFTVLSDAYAIRWIFNGINLLPNQYLFVLQCINKVTNLPIYSYKNKLGGWNVVKNKSIQLPTKNGEPDYVIMDTFISAILKLVIKDVVLYADKKIASIKEEERV